MSSPLTSAEVLHTAAWIATQQEESGAIPWHAGGHLDPWDHVQAAMGLSVAGFHAQAERAYAWSAAAQRPDGSWAAKYVEGEPVEHYLDTNFTAYIATGVWHQWLVLGSHEFVTEMWPTVEAAIEAVLPCQRADGAFVWTPGEPHALVTGNASISFSLRCALGLARLVGESRPAWERAAAGVSAALADASLFEPKPHSMDWYYPLLGAPWPAEEMDRRVKAGWDTFVVPGLGVKCVTPNTWVTGAESCELVLALVASGRPEAAQRVFADMQHLREADGSYWTGFEYESEQRWPDERTTWTAATVLLAHDALVGMSEGSNLFAGDGLDTEGAVLEWVAFPPNPEITPVALPDELVAVAAATKGFLPDDEADALRAVVAAHLRPGGVAVEIGTYCGKSAIHLGHVAREAGATLLTLDHHRGSEEQQPGWEYHDTELVDAEIGAMDTLPFARRALHRAGLEEVVVPVVGRSTTVSAFWTTPLDAVFIDGGHTEEAAQADYAGWAPHVREGGVLVIHDVFPDPADGGQAPFHVYERALADGFTEVLHVGSLRAVRR